MSDRLLLTIPPRPDVMDFTGLLLAVTEMYPGLTMDFVRQADDGSFEVRVPVDARPIVRDEDDDG